VLAQLADELNQKDGTKLGDSQRINAMLERLCEDMLDGGGTYGGGGDGGSGSGGSGSGSGSGDGDGDGDGRSDPY
jgi:hypothetical protein